MKVSTASLLLITATACTAPDPFLPFTSELSSRAIEQCQLQNPSVRAQQCNIKHCLSNAPLLKGMDQLLRDVSDVLESLKIRYWIEGGTLYGARRFQAFLPWDDDVDIDVVGAEFEPYLEMFRRAIESKGYRMVKWGGYFGTPTLLWQIVFSKDKYREHLLTSDSKISFDDVDRLVAEYDLHDSLPHLDIFPFDYINANTLQYRTFSFKDVVPQGYDYNIIFAPEGTRQPTRRILDREYPVPNKLEEYLNLYIGSKDASDVVLQTPHSNACTAKLRFRDIKKDKELLKYLKEYLIFVFGNRFKALAPDYEES